MIKITTFANPRVAQAFVDYMATQGIALTIQKNDTYDILLADEDKAAIVDTELTRFIRNPNDPRYQAASWQAGKSNVNFSYKCYPFFATLKERAGPLTLIVMGLCTVIFVLMSIMGYPLFLYLFGWPISEHQHYQVWRYFTHSLLQFSFMQLVFNLLWWWYLGGAVEKSIGTGKLLTLTLIASLLSGFMQATYHSPIFGGLSGTVFALMGYVWLRGLREPSSGVQMQQGLFVFAIIWLAIEYVTHGSALPAHFTGFLLGLAMAFGDTLTLSKRK